MAAYRYTFSEFIDDDLVDWQSFNQVGENYSSYIETGHELLGDAIAEKEANTVYCFFKRTEENIVDNDGTLEYDQPSSCYLRGKWHWTDSDSANRWSESQQVYRFNRFTTPVVAGVFDYGFEVIQTINQVRGKGRALSLRFESEEGKDFHLLGWSVPYTGILAP